MKKEYLILDTYIRTVSKGIRGRRTKKELRYELLSHLLEIYDRNIALGMSDEDAQKDAVSHMGEPESVSKTFKKLYPISSLDFLENNMSRLAGCIGWSLYILATRTEPLSSLIFLYTYYVISETLFHCRKANKQFNFAFDISVINFLLLTFGGAIYNYFSLSIETYHVIIVISALISYAEYIFIFSGIKELEKRLNIQKKDSRSPIISCILLILVHTSAAYLLLTNSDYFDFLNSNFAFLIGIFAFIVAFFPISMLGDSAELFDEIELEIPTRLTKAKRYKKSAIEIAIFLSGILLLNGLGFLASNRPTATTDFAIHDMVTQVNTEAIREDLISLGLPENIAYDLPDSEILKYNGAERMEINVEEEYFTADFEHRAYAFYLPETDTKPQRVRILFVLRNFEVYDELYRDGVYWHPDSYSVDYSNDFNEGSFCQVLCELNGKQKIIIPFYQKDLKEYSDIYSYPIGCDFGFIENGINHRIYLSQTIIPKNTDYNSIIVYLNYYHTDSKYTNTRHTHYVKELNDGIGLNGSYSNRIRAEFNYNPTYIENTENDYNDLLQNLIAQFSNTENIDLDELEKALEEELGYDVNSDLLEDIVNQINDEAENL